MEGGGAVGREGLGEEKEGFCYKRLVELVASLPGNKETKSNEVL